MSRHHQAIKNDPRWKAARLLVLERDGHACTFPDCGATEDLTVDHSTVPLWRIMEDGGDPFNTDDLVTLCRPHNSSKGGREREAVRITWVNPRYGDVIGFLNDTP